MIGRVGRRAAWTGLIAVVLCAGLSGCGKKPEFVSPPQGEEADRFPRTYPNPALDPKPESTPR